ncbi:MAG: DUF5956 family protein [Marmoricola sp.]
MVAADWDEHGVPAALSDVEDHVHYVATDDVEMIPEVQAAWKLGWEPAPEAPLWCFLPAIWPRRSRTSVSDVRVRSGTSSCSGTPNKRVPWSTATYADIEQSMNSLLAECGLPARPAGRIWLLRPPARSAPSANVLDRLLTSAKAADLAVIASAAFVERVADELEHLFSSPA